MPLLDNLSEEKVFDALPSLPKRKDYDPDSDPMYGRVKEPAQALTPSERLRADLKSSETMNKAFQEKLKAEGLMDSYNDVKSFIVEISKIQSFDSGIGSFVDGLIGEDGVQAALDAIDAKFPVIAQSLIEDIATAVKANVNLAPHRLNIASRLQRAAVYKEDSQAIVAEATEKSKTQ